MLPVSPGSSLGAGHTELATMSIRQQQPRAASWVVLGRSQCHRQRIRFRGAGVVAAIRHLDVIGARLLYSREALRVPASAQGRLPVEDHPHVGVPHPEDNLQVLSNVADEHVQLGAAGHFDLVPSELGGSVVWARLT